MLNTLHQLTKISFLAILLAMIAWIAIDALAKGSAGNNQHSPLLDYAEGEATATPLIDSKLSQLGSTQLQSRPTECSITPSRSHQAEQNRSLNRAQLEARTPPDLIAALLYPVSLPVMSTMSTNVDAIYDKLRYLQSNTSARKAPHLSTCLVTTPADSGTGSLRQCLLDTTANGTITFDQDAFPEGTPTTISLSSALPAITSDGLTIDGSHAGVVLFGDNLSSEGYGLVIDGADNVTIRGLHVTNFSEIGILIFNGASNTVIGGNTPEARNIIGGNKIGIQISSSGSSNNQVIGNYIGTDATGTIAWQNEIGVALTAGAQNNVIGGTELERNLISGNEVGVLIHDEGTNSNQVRGNFIGTDFTGTAKLSNDYGIGIRLAAQNNIIGGETEQARNIISGNRKTGVQIQGTDTNNNQVLGNYIGTNVDGNAPLGNDAGIGILPGNNQSVGPSNNVIGGSVEAARNIISGNDGAIQILSSNQNRIQGNYIGTDETGMNGLSNIDGIIISDNAQNNIIGGSTEDARNIISGNEKNGIWIGTWRSETRRRQATSGNQVLGNYIGVNAEGTAILSNTRGIILNESQNNIVGCESLEGCNIISGNSEAGIMIQGGASDNQVIGNFIGTNADGTIALPNGYVDINGNPEAGVGIGIIEGSHDNIIGGDTEGKRNIISGNIQTGIDIRNADTTNNQVIGNYIGTNKKGDAALPNRWGVAIVLDAHHNIIGGTGSAGNLISGNTEAGVQIQGVVPQSNGSIEGQGADDNRVQGNYIGTNAAGSKALGNRWGIDVLAGAKNNLIGGTEAGEGNLISGNLESGIEILNYSLSLFETKENQIQGNQIGVAADGSSPLGNGFAGVCLFLGASSNTIGPGNTIAHNADAGVRIQDDSILRQPVGNTITQNTIHDNSGLPIDFTDAPAPITQPTLSNSSGNAVSGTTCANCQIEIFGNPDSTPAGTDFLVAGNADSNGNFTITLPSDPSCLSATATDQAGTTSEFSDNLCEQSTKVTNTPTASNTPSVTPTMSQTPTVTPMTSNTPSVTPTATPVTVTPTASNSPTTTPVTVTPTASNSPTATSVTVTPTASNSPTTTPVTVTPTASNSPTTTPVTVTPTASNSPTVTPTSSNSPTPPLPFNQLYLPLVIR